MQLMFVLIATAVVAGFVGIGIGVAEGSAAIILGSLVLSGIATFFGIQLRRRILSDHQS
ncbi:YlaF family protein [Exiguobacterium sp. s131]|uniref:YlaF family protein n=1 Tax=Exiguobacterium sp. s131 TaxID=2751278 RepID=UPI001BE6C0F4|nr:YlaF family protein [Exiguobacterium sp. s131]